MPARITMFLESVESFVVELVFVTVVLGEGTFAVGWKDLACDDRHGLVAGRNKTGGVGFGVTELC